VGLVGLLVVAGAVIAVIGVGGSASTSSGHSITALSPVATHPPPLAIQPSGATGAAGSGASVGTHPAQTTPGHAGQTVAGASKQSVAEVRDPEESRSFPVSPQVRARYHAAAKPAKAADAFVAPGALSTAQVQRELKRLQALEHSAQGGLATLPGGESIGGNGTIPIPPDVPAVIQRVIAGANEITDLPYVYGGGHASFEDNAYDCSGSVSYALAAGGLLSAPETSGELESWGAPGPGNWITVYASAGHVYMYVNVGGAWMRYDTVGRSGPFASRWHPYIRSNEGFVARHWPGL
jgi:cell wall-associated NlpC family hydrolase